MAVQLPRKLVNALGLKPGDELEVVAANPTRIVVAKLDRWKEAVDRMRARAWPMPDGYSLDRDEVNAR